MTTVTIAGNDIVAHRRPLVLAAHPAGVRAPKGLEDTADQGCTLFFVYLREG